MLLPPDATGRPPQVGDRIADEEDIDPAAVRHRDILLVPLQPAQVPAAEHLPRHRRRRRLAEGPRNQRQEPGKNALFHTTHGGHFVKQPFATKRHKNSFAAVEMCVGL